MDRIYVKHQNKVPVHQLGLDKWRDVVVRNKRVRERLLTTLLDLVQKERTGEVIDRALMRSITMVSLIHASRPVDMQHIASSLACMDAYPSGGLCKFWSCAKEHGNALM